MNKQILLHKTKGAFELHADTSGEIRFGVCYNGALSTGTNRDQNDGVFQFIESDGTFRAASTGATLFPNSQFPQEFANVYDRRRIAGIKMKYLPYYSNFPASSGLATASTSDTELVAAIQIPHMAITWDRDGIEDMLPSADYDDIRAQQKSKTVRLDRPWKIYRKSTLFPTFQKFPNTGGTTFTDQGTTLRNQVNLWGQWQQPSTSLASGADKNGGITPTSTPNGVRIFHIMGVSKPVVGFVSVDEQVFAPVGQIDFTVYHVLADRR